MTKRFTNHDETILDSMGEQLISTDEIVDLLNSLNDENEQLKQRVNLLSDEINAQGIVIEGYQNRNQKLFDENEELKHQKQVLIDYMDNWCPKRFYDAIIKRMEDYE